MNFSIIAAEYESMAKVQKSAGDLLLSMLKIQENDDVLDVGCGTGSITRKIRQMTRGRIVGIDPSEGMIKEARRRSKGIEYEVKSAEEMDYFESFDVIVCNSSMQWFRDVERAVKNFYMALRKGGRVGVQAPARSVYSPNFIRVTDAVKNDKRTKDVFFHFRSPWFFLEREDEYCSLFERQGFKVPFSKIEEVVTKHTVDEAFRIFMSGAAAGYLNPRYYDVDLPEDYTDVFKKIARKEFEKQAVDGVVSLKFNRIFLIAVKE